MVRSITIVGASLAGIRAAQTLRSDGFGGSITIVGDEPHRPYDRPPLSKQVLAGKWEAERAMLHDPAELDALDLDWVLGTRARSLDAGDRVVRLDDGRALPADGVLIATGARPRSLPGTEHLDGVFTLRTIDDCLRLRAAFEAVPERVVVVGAGFIGAEVAATAAERGLAVTMIEAEAAPLVRVLGPEIGAVCADLHRSHGVDLRLGVGVDAVESEPTGGVAAVALSDGSAVACDVVVVGIGVVPNTDWLDGSGLELDDGVVCDQTCLAAPGITAAGDVARWPNPTFGGALMRVEHWDNAVEQGMYAARRLLATDRAAEAYGPVPWFWSDQYDRKMQLAGWPQPGDQTMLVDGSVAEGRFATAFGRDGRLMAIFGMNRPRQVMQYRRLIADGADWETAVSSATPG